MENEIVITAQKFIAILHGNHFISFLLVSEKTH